MATLNIKRVLTLPGVLETSTMYVVKHPTNANLVDITFVGNTLADVRHIFGQADVDAAVQAAIAALTADDIPDLPGSKITSPVAEAAKLSPGATINGVAFDGTAAITVSAEDTVTPRVKVSDVGITVAPLNETGTIDPQYLPNGLDNVDIVADYASLPAEGRADTLYVTSDTNLMYRWSAGEPGQYILISAGGGTADIAVRLATPRQIALSGDVTGSTMFDGTANVTITATLRALTEADIPSLPGTKISSPVASADKLTTGRKIILSGGVTGEGTFDGTGDVTIVTTGGLPEGGYNGTSIKTTYVNGQATGTSALLETDIPDLPGTKITSAVELAKALEITAEW